MRLQKSMIACFLVAVIALVGIFALPVQAETAACQHDYTADPTTCGICGNVRAALQITHVTLRPTCAGLYFKGSFTFDDAVQVSRYGIAVSLSNQEPVADDTDASSMYTADYRSVLISNILDGGADDAASGARNIYARPYVLLADGTYIYGNAVTTNLQVVAEVVNDQWTALTDTQKAAAKAMYDTFSDTMQSWDVPELKSYRIPNCTHCNQAVDWIPWDGTAFAADGHYYLESDLLLTGEITVSNNVVLDLKGCTVTAAENKRCFTAKGDFAVMDTSAAKTGTITGGHATRGGNIYVNANGSFTLYSGTVSGGIADNALGTTTTNGRGGNIFGNGGNVTLKGGTVSGGTAVDGSSWGGNIFMTGGTLTVEGSAVISGGSAETGGNVYMMYAAMVMTGGQIDAGGVYLRGSGGSYSSLTMSGGAICDNVSNYEADSTVTVSGTAKIASLTLKGALNIGELTEGASIKVNKTAGTFTDALTNANDVVAYFGAVDSTLSVIVNAEGKLEVVKQAYCPHCSQTIHWTQWDGTAATGHFYLSGPVDLTETVGVASEKDFVIDLNGQTVTADGCRVFHVTDSATLSVVDSVGTGVITGGTSTGRGGNIYASGGNVCLYGGAIYGGTAPSDGNNEGRDVAVYNGAFTVNGNVTIGQVYETGHAVYTFNATELKLTKGSVTGGILFRGQSGIELSSDLVVDTLALRDSKIAAVAARADSAQTAIKITNAAGEALTGEFTGALDNASEAAAYFASASADYKVVVNPDNKLELVDTAATVCAHCGEYVMWTDWDGATVSTGHYILKDHVQLTGKLTIKNDVALDLNGYTITAAENLQAFLVNGTLSVLDSSETKTGTITGGKALDTSSTFLSRGGNIAVNGGELNIYGGTITGGEAVSRGGNIYISGNGIMNMYGGKVSGGVAQSHANDIFANYSTVNVFGGEIVGTAENGIYSIRVCGYNEAFAYINISGGTVTSSNLTVMVDDALASATVSGGTVSGKMSANSAAMFKVEGNPVIEDLNLTDTLVTVGEMTEGASVKINATEGVFTDVLENASDVAQYFDGVKIAYKVVVNTENKLEVQFDSACACDHCEGAIWAPWNGEVTTGHYYLTQPVQLDGVVTINADDEVVLDLKGYTITAKEGKKAFNLAGDLAILDTSEAQTGTVTGGSAYRGGNIYVQETGSFTLFSGSIVNGLSDGALSTGTTGGRGGNIFGNGGNVTLKGGVVSGGTVANGSNWGGNIFMTGGTLTVEEGAVISGGSAKAGGNVYLMYANMIMTGGQIKEGTVTTNGDAVYLNGTATGGYSALDISGGAVSGNVYSNNAAVAITVSGTAQVTDLDLNNSLLNVGKLAEGASIKINAPEGAFTDVLENASDVIAYFDAFDEAYNVGATEDGKLAVVPVCPCGCGITATDVIWIDANAFFAACAEGYADLSAADKEYRTKFNGENMHLRLTADLNITEIYGTTVQIQMGNTDTCKIILDLNGYTWSSNHRMYVYEGSELVIMDTSAAGTGVMTSTGYSGSGRVIINYGTITMLGGTITMTETGAKTITTGGVVYMTGNSVFNMYGGSIIDGRADGDTGAGGNVYIRSGTTFNMYGGTISGGTAAQGSNIYVAANGTFNQEGGTVENKDNTIYQAE